LPSPSHRPPTGTKILHDIWPPPSSLWHPERNKGVPNRPLPKSQGEEASRLERLVTALPVVAKGAPAGSGDEGESARDSKPEGNAPASKLEYKHVDEVYAHKCPTSLEID